jgi:hypothetical protein
MMSLETLLTLTLIAARMAAVGVDFITTIVFGALLASPYAQQVQ